MSNAYEDTLVEAIDLCERRRLLKDLYENLPEREREILGRRFGMNGEPPESRASIGRVLGMTSERVRQLEMFALRRLMLSVDARTADSTEKLRAVTAKERELAVREGRLEQRLRREKVALIYRMVDSGMSVEDTARMTGCEEVVVRHLTTGQRGPLP